MHKSSCDLQMVLRTLQLIHPPGSVIEIRMPKASRWKTVSGYFDAPEALVKAVVPYAAKPEVPGIYFTLNQCDAALFARAANVLKPYADTTTADTDIVRRRALGIDFDPKRPARISSTEAEHTEAIRTAYQCRAWLSAMGWPEPIYADSGNGGHLVYGLDLPNDDETQRLIEKILAAIDLCYSTPEMLVDTAVFNAARIWKLYGTMARKGSHIPERPHRLSRILEAPDALTPVPLELLHAVAERAPTPSPRPTPAQGMSGRTIDAARWLTEHGIEVQGTKPWKGGTLYKLAVCPWNSEHTDNDARVIQWPNGALDAGCFHNSCRGKGWQDLRDLMEPERGARHRTRHTRATRDEAETLQPAGQLEDTSDAGHLDEITDERDAIQQEAGELLALPCPDTLWIGRFADVSAKLGKRSWEIWAGTLAALAATANRHLCLRYHGSLFGMVYVLLVKPTGLGKSECTHVCRALLPTDYVVRDAVQSGPGLAPVLADIQRDAKWRVLAVRSRPAILVMEEWTTLLKNAGIANSTLTDTLNSLFHRAWPWNVSRSDRPGGGGDLIIPDPILTICATTTNALLRQYVGEGFIRSGAMNRYLMLPGSSGAWKFYHPEAAGLDYDVLRGFLDDLREHRWIGGTVWAAYSDAARARMVAHGQETLEPVMGSDTMEAEAVKRLHVYLHIIALLYAWSEHKRLVELPHVEASIAAVAVAKVFVQGLMRAPIEAELPAHKRYEIALEQRIVAYIQGHPGCSRRDVVRAMSGTRTAKSGDVGAILNQLISNGLVRLEHVPGKGKKLRECLYVDNAAKSTT